MITLYHTGGSATRVSLENGRGTSEYEVQFIQSTQPRERLQVLTSRRMRVPEGAPIEVEVTDQDRALAVSSPTATVQYDLEMKTVTRREEASLDRRDVVQSAGTVQTMQPRSWQNLRTTGNS